MYTVITKGNNVSKHSNPAKLGLIDHIIVITDSGEIIVNQGNPITWPADASDGLQAIVDVKEGTLRFAHGWWSWAVTEFVVSTYGDSGTVSAPHIFDLVESWPEKTLYCREPELPEGWAWQWCWGSDWVLSNGTIGLKREDWFKYKFGDCKPAKSFGAVEDGDLSTPVQPKAPVTKEDVMKLIDIWPHDDNIPVNRDVTDNWIWSRKGHKNVIINLVDNVNSGVVITENDWRNYLSEELRKYPPIIGTNHDPVNRPSHYTAGGIECIDAIKASMSTEAFLGFLKGNVQKYMWRYEKKVAPVEDLKKAQWYLSKLIEEQELS